MEGITVDLKCSNFLELFEVEFNQFDDEGF